eukprot:8414297-Pyramimonas_sp.AAC.1
MKPTLKPTPYPVREHHINRKYSGGDLNFPAAEWLNKGLMAVLSPTDGAARPTKLGGELNFSVAEWLNKGLKLPC